ncbi:MAG TPA: 2-dehydropantoate 2-reductase [Alphaproteobacteria bacterium]|nr:2-dehydropantoate 2-reductase [Alphaproteobacteria bacterium]
MKIAVMATGGVGGYFGARLAASGEDVTFVARGKHLGAIEANGLKVESANGDLLIKPARATDDPAKIGPVDIVLFAVKLWDMDTAGAACKPLIGRDTAVVSFLNGVESEGRLAAILGKEHVMGGVAAISSTIAAPGTIKMIGTMATLAFGELDGRKSARGEALLAACLKAGIAAKLSAEIEKDIWTKFVLLASFSGMTALTRATIGPIRDDPELHAMLRAAMGEVVAVARAKGVALPADHAETVLAMVAKFPYEMRASMAVDLERGNRLELPWLSGAVARLGKELGVATPVHAFIATALKLQAGGKK